MKNKQHNVKSKNNTLMFKLSLALRFKPLNLNLSFTVNYAENPHRTYNNNNNNKHFFNLQVANSPSRLRFEANLSRESSECTEHSQDQTSQINTGKTVYVGNA